jgi:tetratricopeptide (TPR) repeat protein
MISILRSSFAAASLVIACVCWDAQCAQKSADPQFLQQQLKSVQSELAKNPRSSFWHNQAAIIYAALHDYQQFDKEIDVTIQLDPANPGNYYLASSVYKERGLLKEAETALRKALKLDSHNPLGHYDLGQLLESKNEYRNAHAEYVTASEELRRLPHGTKRYSDRRGNSYPIELLHERIPVAIERTARSLEEKQD